LVGGRVIANPVELEEQSVGLSQQEATMHHSSSPITESQATVRQKWQEPMILVERSLTANAQGPDPQGGPVFGPLSTTVSTDPDP
jgi:hypothetical protein